MRIVAFPLLAFLAGASGCRDTPDTSASGRDTTQAARVAVPVTPDSVPAGQPRDSGGVFQGTTGRSAREGRVDGVTILDAVRVASHPGYERVVFAFREGIPGYVVEYASDAPTHCGSGELATVAGNAHLTVRLTPTDAHEFSGERASSTIPSRDIRPDGPVLRQLLLTCDFEAEVAWVLGLDARRAYRLMTLASPPRIVLDISTGSR